MSNRTIYKTRNKLIPMCNNQCPKFNAKFSKRTGYKDHEYCKSCDCFFPRIEVGKFCPCCSKQLRYRPRQTKRKIDVVYI